MEDVVNQWKARRIFLTGHTGFKGSWLALWLAKLGARVRGFALDPATEPNLFTVANVGGDIEDVRGDVRNFEALNTSMVEFEPDVVFHLAAQPLVRHSYQDPLGTYATNVMGTAHMLEAVRHCPSVRSVVCVTTDKCYHNQEWVWPYRETDPLGGSDPYASSKACAEIVAAAYRHSYFSNGCEQGSRAGIATVRAGNVIGGGDWSEDRLIPDLIRGFEDGSPVLIRRPKAIRPWQHVLEAVYGYMTLADRLIENPAQFSSAYNFGPDERDTQSVDQVATALATLWGKGAAWTHDQSSTVHETHLLRLDSSKACAELGWKPRLKLQTALEWIVAWHRNHLNGADMHMETLRQITEYERLGQ